MYQTKARAIQKARANATRALRLNSQVHDMSSTTPPYQASEAHASKARLLVIDNRPDNLRLLEAELADYFHLSVAQDGESALHIANAQQPNIILLAITLPGLDGVEVCQRLKSHSTIAPIPLIILMAAQDTPEDFRCLELGACDYIRKPFNGALVRQRIEAHLRAKDAQVLRERAQALEDAVRLRDEIDYLLQHDVKSALSPIIGFSELMLEDDNLTAEQKENLCCIRDSGHRILSVVQRSHDRYNLESLSYRYQPRLEDVSQILRAVVSGMQ